MPPVCVLIKPASSACNMKCKYCFYKDVAANRKNAFEGMLSIKMTEKVISKAMDFAYGTCSFMFQGGEPTLAGLDYFREVVRIEKHYKKSGVKIQNSIQTNGYAIDDEWAAFFHENNFLVGLSLDGPADLHNINRYDTFEEPTFNKVMHTAKLFDKYKVDYNILCVITKKSASSAEKIYNFFKKNNFNYLQFIPCLEPMNKNRDSDMFCLSAKEYEDFLIRIFNLWYKDFISGRYVSIRNIDNYISIMIGNNPEACNMNGKCSIQFVVEGNGNVYPCDFYVLDELCMGNIETSSFEDMLRSDAAKDFIMGSLNVPEECRDCKYYCLCRNGCKRDRLHISNNYGINYYCTSFKGFFEKCGSQIETVARIIFENQ